LDIGLGRGQGGSRQQDQTQACGDDRDESPHGTSSLTRAPECGLARC
jgi:hypothetical protein